jgi:glutathione S-transferase
MKLYYSPGACSLADHIVLEWIGKPYEVQAVSREQRATAEFRKLNPAGAVPVLEHDGMVLTQNMAILHYLADLNPEAGLRGDESPKTRAEINRWLAFVNSDLHPAFFPLFGSTGYLADPEVIEKTKENAKKTIATLLTRADEQLSGRDWLIGSRTIVDPYLFVVLRWARGLGIDLSAMQNLNRFFAMFEADEAVQKVLKVESGK